MRALTQCIQVSDTFVVSRSLWAYRLHITSSPRRGRGAFHNLTSLFRLVNIVDSTSNDQGAGKLPAAVIRALGPEGPEGEYHCPEGPKGLRVVQMCEP